MSPNMGIMRVIIEVPCRVLSLGPESVQIQDLRERYQLPQEVYDLKITAPFVDTSPGASPEWVLHYMFIPKDTTQDSLGDKAIANDI